MDPDDPISETGEPPQMTKATGAKPLLDPKTLPKQHQVYLALRQAGHVPSKAAVLAGYTDSNGIHLERKLAKYDLTRVEFQRLAGVVVKSFLKGEPIGKITEIKAGTTLEAAQMVYDRTQPVVRQSLNVNVDLTPAFVDLSRYNTLEESNAT